VCKECYKTRHDRIRNEDIIYRVGVTLIVEKMVENRLSWFGDVERRNVDSVVRRVDQLESSQIAKSRGRRRKQIKRNY
jgi:hypothetical protein